jgi:hypothetical protein
MPVHDRHWFADPPVISSAAAASSSRSRSGLVGSAAFFASVLRRPRARSGGDRREGV